MNLELVRIDDRFIHGQVAVGWVKYLKINQIIVSNDIIAMDELQKTLMEMAKPPEVEVDILTINETITKIKKGDFLNKRLLLLIDSPMDAYKIVQGGIEILKINIGGMRYKEGKEQVTRTVSLNREDRETFLALDKMGIHLEIRAVPSDSKVDFMPYLNK